MLTTLKDILGTTDRDYNRVAKIVACDEAVASGKANVILGTVSDMQEVQAVKNNETKSTDVVDRTQSRSNLRGQEQMVGPGGDDVRMLVNKKVHGVPIRSIYSMVRAGPTAKNIFEGRDIID
jgi:hypothetical protein